MEREREKGGGLVVWIYKAENLCTEAKINPVELYTYCMCIVDL